MAGSVILEQGYSLLHPAIQVELHVAEGMQFQKGEIIASVTGPVRSILTGERVLLNLLQRLSGIATVTARAVELLDDRSIRICDTRKTTPGLRMLEKYAVRCGGGFNHRLGLDQAVLLKENHLAASGGIKPAVSLVKSKLGHTVKIEVETTNRQEVLEAVDAEVDIIMFDNAAPEEVKHYLQIVPEEIVTEASGGITLDNISRYRNCGVDYLSLGFLTHSIRAIDLSMLLKKEEAF